jgi:hypothetical protein
MTYLSHPWWSILHLGVREIVKKICVYILLIQFNTVNGIMFQYILCNIT